MAFVIDDGTGSIEAREWHDPERENIHPEIKCVVPHHCKLIFIHIFFPRENMYVRVMGGLFTLSQKRYIKIRAIRLVKCPHEIYCHLLEAMAVYTSLEKGIVRNQS